MNPSMKRRGAVASPGYPATHSGSWVTGVCSPVYSPHFTESCSQSMCFSTKEAAEVRCTFFIVSRKGFLWITTRSKKVHLRSFICILNYRAHLKAPFCPILVHFLRAENQPQHQNVLSVWKFSLRAISKGMRQSIWVETSLTQEKQKLQKVSPSFQLQSIL